MQESKVKFKDVIGIKDKKTISSLGIETLGGQSTILIKKGTVVPSKVAQTFSTAEDNQPAVSIRVLKGESVMAADNKMLSNFELVDIPSVPRGIPQIQVIFDIDEKGSLSVSAIDKETNKGQKIEIQKSGKVKTKSASSSDIVEEESIPWAGNPVESKSNGTLDKFFNGKLDLAAAFWGIGVFGSIIVGLICGFLVQAVGKFFIFILIGVQLAIIVGLWRCAETHKQNMITQKKSTVWSVLTQAYCVLSALGVLTFIKDFF